MKIYSKSFPNFYIFTVLHSFVQQKDKKVEEKLNVFLEQVKINDKIRF